MRAQIISQRHIICHLRNVRILRSKGSTDKHTVQVLGPQNRLHSSSITAETPARPIAEPLPPMLPKVGAFRPSMVLACTTAGLAASTSRSKASWFAVEAAIISAVVPRWSAIAWLALAARSAPTTSLAAAYLPWQVGRAGGGGGGGGQGWARRPQLGAGQGGRGRVDNCFPGLVFLIGYVFNVVAGRLA